jgi:hypothetical protein
VKIAIVTVPSTDIISIYKKFNKWINEWYWYLSSSDELMVYYEICVFRQRNNCITHHEHIMGNNIPSNVNTTDTQAVW